MPELEGADTLRLLMEEHKLTQADLPEVGSQGVVSEILRGKRALNVRQIRALSKRFGVSPIRISYKDNRPCTLASGHIDKEKAALATLKMGKAVQ